MKDNRYLIDCNALSKLTRKQRSSGFFRKNCRIPTEVLYEARWFPDIHQLSDVEYKTTGSVLVILAEVMATVPVGDKKLVDLYANQGNADPLIVACAVDATREREQQLFGETWAIVSDDKAVRAKANEFDIEILASEEFIAIL
ncbi:hypothetical protein [Mycolicibacterium phocaicum]|uniref:hypothetical protein n=1 Tax=Mycolicibacterium phocaicum TaxID=319706 RepID=UPI001CFA1D3C|nr:hypothetical protein [Mycolicibacterium phocaicum]UCZ60145.1 hypothetical protein LHJ73_26395 [Mycolicibacterium phocaicum]